MAVVGLITSSGTDTWAGKVATKSVAAERNAGSGIGVVVPLKSMRINGGSVPIGAICARR